MIRSHGRLGITFKVESIRSGSHCKARNVSLTSIGPQRLIATISVGSDCEDVGRVESTGCPNGEAGKCGEGGLDIGELLAQTL